MIITFEHRFDCAHEMLVELAKFMNDDAAFPLITFKQMSDLKALVGLAQKCERLGQHTNLADDEIRAAP